jgi:AcrR family transcriptional regulator
MAVRLTRAESALQTRRRLLEAAHTVFFQRGFHGATLEAVAEEAGLTKGAVYSRFESKADLFLAFQEERNEQALRQLTEELAGVSSRRQLLTWFREYWAMRLREAPEWTLLVIEFWASACRDAELQARFSDQHARLMAGAGALVEEAAVRLGVTLPASGEALAITSTAIGHGLMLERLLAPEKVDEPVLRLAYAFTDEPDGAGGGRRRPPDRKKK